MPWGLVVQASVKSLKAWDIPELADCSELWMTTVLHAVTNPIIITNPHAIRFIDPLSLIKLLVVDEALL